MKSLLYLLITCIISLLSSCSAENLNEPNHPIEIKNCSLFPTDKELNRELDKLNNSNNFKGFLIENRCITKKEVYDPINDINESIFGYLDQNDKLAIPHIFESAFPFKNGIAKVRLNSHWGFIDSVGNTIIKPKYKNIERFGNNYFINETGVLDNYKYKILNMNGITIFSFNGSDPTFLEDNLMIFGKTTKQKRPVLHVYNLETKKSLIEVKHLYQYNIVGDILRIVQIPPDSKKRIILYNLKSLSQITLKLNNKIYTSLPPTAIIWFESNQLYKIKLENKYSIFHINGLPLVDLQEQYLTLFGDYVGIKTDEDLYNLFNKNNLQTPVYENVDWRGQDWISISGQPNKLIQLKTNRAFDIPIGYTIKSPSLLIDSIVILRKKNEQYFYHLDNHQIIRLEEEYQFRSRSFPIKVKNNKDEYSFLDRNGNVLFPWVKLDNQDVSALEDISTPYYDSIAVRRILNTEDSEFTYWILHSSGCMKEVPYLIKEDAFSGGCIIPVTYGFVDYTGRYLFNHPYQCVNSFQGTGKYGFEYRDFGHLKGRNKFVMRYTIDVINKKLLNEESIDFE